MTETLNVELTSEEVEQLIDCIEKVIGDWECHPGELDHLRALAAKLQRVNAP